MEEKNEVVQENENDKDLLFKSPFHQKLWALSSNEMKSVRNLCLIALIIALRVIANAFSIPIVKGYLEIAFDFIPAMIGGLLFGPIVAIYSGAIGDIAGFLLNPSSDFNLCYTLSAILSGFIYALFLYKQKITILRIFVSKLIVNLFVNSFLGTLWIYIYYNTKGRGFLVLLGTRLIKNLISLPIETTVMVLFIALFIPFLKARGFISEKMSNRIHLF